MSALPVAPPDLIVEAWEVGVMHGYMNANFARLVREGEITFSIPDPTYHRSDAEGWRSASDITNQSAQLSLTGYLANKGYRVPDATQAAWDESNRRAKHRKEILDLVKAIMRRIEDDADLRGENPTAYDYAYAVAEDITRLAEDLA